MGPLSIEAGINEGIATASLSDNILTITPKGEGQTSVTVTEGNGQQKVTINITVKATDIKADKQDVTVYVNGTNSQVTITGTNAGELSIETPADGVHATAELADGILTITGLAEGETSVTIKEGNGNKTVTINIHVLETSIEATNTNVIAYVSGGNQTVTLSGENAGTFSLVQPVDETYATITLNGNTLTITPKAAGSTSVKVKEANGNKEITINIEVKETSIDATSKNVIAYVDGNPQTVEITGDNLGTLSATTEPQGIVETSIDKNTLTITPVSEGNTTITVKEANGGKTVTISVEVKTVTIAPVSGSVTLYVGGNPQTVGITGQNYGTLEIVTQPTSTVATAEVGSDNSSIVITPVGAGSTSIKVKEANANKEFTISIQVIQSTITAEPTSVVAYVGGVDKTVQIGGTSIGSLSITDEPESTIATASISGNTLTIHPVGSGDTSVEVTESNGNQKVTVDIHVQATSITPQTVEVYAGGDAKTVEIQGLNMGTLTITKQPNTSYATASIEGTTLTVTPTQTAGNTSLVLTEANGGKTATISINVLATSITAEPSSITANVSDGNQTVQLGGTNHGAFTIVTQPNSSVATASISGSTLTITPKGGGETSVVVKEANGNKQLTINITISAEITAGDVPATDYGAIVNGYECTNSAAVNSWKIFYADEENVYLIADDYIHYNYCPPSKNYTISINSDYKLSMNNVINDYVGSASITDARIKALNNDYFTKGYTSSNNNMKAVAYMLDTNVWSVYAGDKADYAVGGPSIEMLMKSYSEKHGVDYRAQASSSTGYQISTDGGKTWNNYMTTSSEYLDSSDSTYVISSTAKANAMWVASPSANDSYYLMIVYCTGYVDGASYSRSNLGFRPLVCLKSDVRLEKNDDGSYTIVEPPKNNNIEPSDYGAEVKGYESEYSDAVGWKIFYADTENTYLIADDYINKSYCPDGAKGSTINDNGNGYMLSMNKVINDYAGSASITDARIKALNNDYYTKGYSSTNNNMKAVAYMLDTNAWSVYAGDKADYAVGGPSIEMLMKSYSEKHGVDYRVQASSSTGYQISNNGGTSWADYYSNMLSRSDRTYVINSTSNASAYWVASPSANDASRLMHVNYSGHVDASSYAYPYWGFRPLVCLKSDVRLQKNSDGSYTIN